MVLVQQMDLNLEVNQLKTLEYQTYYKLGHLVDQVTLVMQQVLVLVVVPLLQVVIMQVQHLLFLQVVLEQHVGFIMEIW